MSSPAPAVEPTGGATGGRFSAIVCGRSAPREHEPKGKEMNAETADYEVIDAVVNIWTEEALAHRPGWGDDFFVDKMNVSSGSSR